MITFAPFITMSLYVEYFNFFYNCHFFCILFYFILFLFNSIRRRIRLFGEALFVQFKNLNLSRQEKLEPTLQSTKTMSGHERTDIVINKNLYRRKSENQISNNQLKILGLERTSIYKQKSFTDENRRIKSTTIN